MCLCVNTLMLCFTLTVGVLKEGCSLTTSMFTMAIILYYDVAHHKRLLNG